MLSSLNAFGGLSAAELLTLFGMKSSSSSSSATSKSTAQAASTGVSGSSAKNPTNAIQAILAQAQIAQAQTATSASIATVAAAYAAQTFEGSSTSATTQEATVTQPPGGSATSVTVAAQADSSSSLPSGDIPFGKWTADQQIADVAEFTQSLMEPSGAVLPFSVNTQAVSAAYNAQLPGGSATTVAEETVQARIGLGATDPGGGGLVVSVLGEAASAAEPGSSSSLASASATFLAPDAYQQIASGGGSAISLAEAAYAAQTSSSSSLGSANVMLSLPDTAQQIAYAVAEIDADSVYIQDVGPVAVTAADAVNVTIANGAMTATQGGTLPSGLPSLASIQQAISTMNALDSDSVNKIYTAGWNPGSAYEGSLTLVQLPPDSLGAYGGNFITLGTTGDALDNWALVLPRDEVTVTVAQAQTTASGT